MEEQYLYMYGKRLKIIYQRQEQQFLASIVIWVVLNFGPNGMVEDMSKSFGSYIGKVVAPILKPNRT